MIPSATLPCEHCEEVSFLPLDEKRAVGYLDCASACVAVRYEQDPQPHLTFYPPLRLAKNFDVGCEFFDACLDEGDERWFDFEFNDATGTVRLRRDLARAEPADIDIALGDARVFFDEHWQWIEGTVTSCGGTRAPRSPWSRLIRALAEM